MTFANDFTRMFNLKLPLVMAPMFLVSNEKMIKEGMEAGILACFPSLNYRSGEELDSVLSSLNNHKNQMKGPGNYGVNLIVQKTNLKFEEHLQSCVKAKVPLIITSLGNPKVTIEAVHNYGGKVFCDVTNYVHAKKCYELGCDGFIAVGQGAGGHAGPHPLILLIEMLKKNFPDKPVLAAGGIADGNGMLSAIAGGASAAYCGTVFIATKEASVNEEYKNAIVDSGMEDIVMTTRISGTPCSIINTPFAKKIGTQPGFLERWMSRNPKTKKYFKMLTLKRGFNWLEEAIKPGNYNNLWCAGQTVEIINEIKTVKEIVNDFEKDFYSQFEKLKKSFSE